MTASNKVLHGATDGPDGRLLSFRCPGCGDVHQIYVHRQPGQAGPVWGWNGDEVRPTFTPSILATSGHYCTHFNPGERCWCSANAEEVAAGREPFSYDCYRCHSYVTDGRIQFLGDCSHHLAGQTVDLPAWSEAEPA
jgi:hypothetical protein